MFLKRFFAIDTVTIRVKNNRNIIPYEFPMVLIIRHLRNECCKMRITASSVLYSSYFSIFLFAQPREKKCGNNFVVMEKEMKTL